MKKLTLILSFIITTTGFAQTGDFFRIPKDFSQEFDKVSKESSAWYSNNKSVIDYDFNRVDNNTILVLKNYPSIQDFDLLVQLLSKNCVNDLEKARAYYFWITHSIVYNNKIREEFSTIIKSSDSKEDDMIYCFKKRQGVCLEISAMFYYMCKKGNVKAFTVGGFVKTPKSSIEYNEGGHAWNVFKYNNSYYFLDATFGLQTKVNNKSYKNFNFNINPEIYKYTYTPLDMYGSLSYKYDNHVYTSEKEWIISHLEYEKDKRLEDINNRDFQNCLLIVNKNYNIQSHSVWLSFPLFEYKYFNIEVKEVNNTVEKNEPHSFDLITKKEYKKLNGSSKVKYDTEAKTYYTHWISYYKDLKEDVKSNPVKYKEASSKLSDLQADYVDYLLYK